MSLAPSISGKNLTMQEPFSLNTDARGADKQVKFAEFANER